MLQRKLKKFLAKECCNISLFTFRFSGLQGWLSVSRLVKGVAQQEERNPRQTKIMFRAMMTNTYEKIRYLWRTKTNEKIRHLWKKNKLK